MMKLIRGLGILLASLILLVGLVALGARMSDGPIAIFPGGPLESGEWVDGGRVDWSFAADIDEIEFESGGRSRTAWILVHEGEAYIPCSLNFPPGKRWHEEILERPEAVLRVEGKRYKRKLVKVEDEALIDTLTAVVAGKYTPPPGSGEGNAWFFHVVAR